MPVGRQARRQAARNELELALAGIRCALELLLGSSDPVMHCALLHIIAGQLARAEDAVRRLA
jgi:hypothetical protein